MQYEVEMYGSLGISYIVDPYIILCDTLWIESDIFAVVFVLFQSYSPSEKDELI